MPQFFKRGNRWLSLREIRKINDKKKGIEPATIEPEVTEPELEKPFCEHCDAKGPIKHKANCPTLIKQ